MSSSKAKGKARTGSANNARSIPKRSSFASAATRSSFAAALASQGNASLSNNSSGDHSDGSNASTNDSFVGSAGDTNNFTVNKSLLPDKSDGELTYEELVKALNASIATSSPENSKLTITEAIPSMRELVSLRYDLKRLLNISTTQLTECDKNLSKLKRLSTALDRESTKRMKVINAAAGNSSSSSDSKPKSMTTSSANDTKDTSASGTSAAASGSPSSKSKATDQFSNSNAKAKSALGSTNGDELVTIKTEANEADTSALFQDTIGLSEPDTRYKTPPEYEKNPKSEFVESQELPIAALKLFEEQVKGLPTTGKEYLLKKFAVSSYPEDDLKDWLPGTIPDLDFTKAKPPNQVQFSTFSTYIEPYFRPFVEEDLHFLEQKLAGSSYDYSYTPTITGTSAAAQAAAVTAANKCAQLSPYVIPKLGRLYSEVWKEQDGPNPGYTLNPPEPVRSKEVAPHGSSEGILDSELERNDISCGPLASRLLSAILSEEHLENVPLSNKPASDSVDENSGDGLKIKTEKNGDESSKANTQSGNISNDNNNNSESNNGSSADLKKDDEGGTIKQEIKPENGETSQEQKSELFDTEEENEKDDSKGRSMTLENTNWKVGVKNKDFFSLEERLKQELKYVGIIDTGMLKKEEEQKQNFEDIAGPPPIPLPPAMANHKNSSLSASVNDDSANGSSSSGSGNSANGSSGSGGKDGKLNKANEKFDIDWVNGREDDEISTELRYLQRQLHRVSRLNMAYQRVLHPIVQQQLAWQEYSNILEDLDKQVDQAYMRRNRATTRIKKKKTSGVHNNHSAANGGVSGSAGGANGTGTPTPGSAAANAAEQSHRMRSLLDKRLKWINMIGPVFESSKKMKSMPKESIFSHIDVDELVRNGGEGLNGELVGVGVGNGHGNNGSGGHGNGVNGAHDNEVEDAMMDAFDKTRGGTPSGKVDDLYGIVPHN